MMDTPPALRILTYNVHRCRGLDGLLSPQRIADALAQAQADVVALQEIDVGSARTNGVDQAGFLARALGMDVHFQPVRPVGEGWSGVAVLTRRPSRLVRAGLLPALRVARGLVPRGALWVAVETGSGELHVVNTHLSLIGRERARQAAALLGPDWLGGLAPGEPRVLLGDFNAVPRSVTYRAIARVLSDAQRLSKPRLRPKPTFPARLPTLRLDHVFVDAEVMDVVGVEVPRDVLTRAASDHLPLVVDVAPVREPARSPPPFSPDAAATPAPEG